MEVIDRLQDLTLEEKKLLDLNIFSEGFSIMPNKILHDKKLSAVALKVYMDISSLCASKGYCWATNDYFANLYGVDVRTIARALKDLDKYIYIKNGGSASRLIWAVTSTGFGSDIDVPTKRGTGKKPPKEKKQVVIKYTKEDLELAEYLLAKILYNYPVYENKPVKIGEWADEMRLLREVEKAKYDQVYFMITWLHGGEIIREGKTPRFFAPHKFWSKNIMSAKKLRKQWLENLVPQLQSELKKVSEVQL